MARGSFVSVETIRAVFGTYGGRPLNSASIDRMLGMLKVDAQGRVPYAQLRELECWDQVLPDGEIVSLRGRPAASSAAASSSKSSKSKRLGAAAPSPAIAPGAPALAPIASASEGVGASPREAAAD